MPEKEKYEIREERKQSKSMKQAKGKGGIYGKNSKIHKESR
jgi:hypothetical protein